MKCTSMKNIEQHLMTYKDKPSPIELDAWRAIVYDLGQEKVEWLIMKHLTTPSKGAFRPRPSDIVEMAYGTHRDCSLRALDKVKKALRMGYRMACFDDVKIHKVIERMGGMQGYHACHHDNLQKWESSFISRYESELRIPSDTSFPSCIRMYPSYYGEDESVNYVGDKEKCIKVYHMGHKQIKDNDK